MKRLVDEDIVFCIPSGEYDDSYAIQKAVLKQGVIISNDRYRDALEKVAPQKAAIFERYLKKHRLSFVFERDEFVPQPSIDFEGPKYRENM